MTSPVPSQPSVMILAGGKGTRLSALYPDLPKALAPVREKPFLHWQLQWLVQSGVRHIHVALGYRADQIKAWIAANPIEGTRITTSIEPHALGTGGAIRFAAPFMETAPFCTLNGDTLLPGLDLQALFQQHCTRAAMATLAVTRIKEAGRYGTVAFDTQDHLTAFREKAFHEAGWVNGGVYMINPELLRLIEPGKAVSLEQEIMPACLGAGRIQVFRCSSLLLDMGTAEGLQEMESYLSGRHAK